MDKGHVCPRGHMCVVWSLSTHIATAGACLLSRFQPIPRVYFNTARIVFFLVTDIHSHHNCCDICHEIMVTDE